MIHDLIRYIALLGPREEPTIFNIPSESMTSTSLWRLGDYPQSMYHYIYGIEQYWMIKNYSLQLGYDLFFLHPDAERRNVELLPWADCSTPIVILVCTDEEGSIETYNNLIGDIVSSDNVLCVVSQKSIDKVSLPVTKVTDEDGVWIWLSGYAYSHYPIEEKRLPFSVPLLQSKVIDTGDVFTPSRVNTQVINAIQGNWGFRYEYSQEDILKMRTASSRNALSEMDGSARQCILLEQIKKIRLLEDLQAQQLGDIMLTEEQYRAPLLLAAPYTSVDMRKPFDNKKGMTPEEVKRAKLIEKVLDVDYTKSYAINRIRGELTSTEELLFFMQTQGRIVSGRMEFFDNVALLHSSFRFSPYFRMPILGKNINAELSFVGIEKLDAVTQSRARNQSIRKTMEKVGEKIVSTALCPESVDFMKGDCAQIVAMSDLPIEWMMIDGVPLGFSHDVCRLPETPVQNLLSQYVESKFTPCTIPKDIMKHTLVVYGNDEEAFVAMQEAVEDQKKKLGFQTRRCLGKEAFFKTVKEVDPLLLIIDTHGGVDTNTHQSYLMIGNDVLTGDDVIGNGIHPRIVFLSACNTFTTYNTVGSIAGAFFEAGAMAVTTSYMPLELIPATTLYCRLLNNLSIAAKKSIHRNWLSFMSHLLRTSYIHSPIQNHSGMMNSELSQALVELSTSSMDFHKRREIYKNLNSNSFTKGMGTNYDYIIPHYLMYSTIGRADLIRFQSFMEKTSFGALPPEIQKELNRSWVDNPIM